MNTNNTVLKRASAHWEQAGPKGRLIAVICTAITLTIIAATAGLFSAVPGAMRFGEYVTTPTEKIVTVQGVECTPNGAAIIYTMAPDRAAGQGGVVLASDWTVTAPRHEPITVSAYAHSVSASVRFETTTTAADIPLSYTLDWPTRGTYEVTLLDYDGNEYTWAGACSKERIL